MTTIGLSPSYDINVTAARVVQQTVIKDGADVESALEQPAERVLHGFALALD